MISRIQNATLKKKLVGNVQDLVQHFRNGMKIGFSGFTSIGYPKLVPLEFANFVEENKLQGAYRFDLYCGASIGSEVDNRWAELELTKTRWPFHSSKVLGQKINQGKIELGDMHLSKFAEDIAYGFYSKERGSLDLSVIEVTEIDKNGRLILGGAVGIVPELVQRSEKIIIEVNNTVHSMKGMHDIVNDIAPPNSRPIVLTKVNQRIGHEYVKVDPSKVVAVIENNKYQDYPTSLAPTTPECHRISEHILDFLDMERRQGRLPSNLLPLQSGVGNVANSVIAGLNEGHFKDLYVWTEAFQDGFLDLFQSGKLIFASTAAMALSKDGMERFWKDYNLYKDKIILRQQHVTNYPGIIRNLGVIGMNTPIEIDIYGHSNSTLLFGTKMVHGIGGSGDFLHNAYISILHTPSTRPTKTDPTGITTIVPFVSHVDHTEHDISVFVTEQGIADVRGLTPKQRAKAIIENCAHPDYKEILMDYFRKAEKECLNVNRAHEPHMLRQAFKMYQHLEEFGTMKTHWD